MDTGPDQVAFRHVRIERGPPEVFDQGIFDHDSQLAILSHDTLLYFTHNTLDKITPHPVEWRCLPATRPRSVRVQGFFCLCGGCGFLRVLFCHKCLYFQYQVTRYTGAAQFIVGYALRRVPADCC